MTVRDALVAAITARLGPARTTGHAATSWWSATFSGERHVFRFELDDPSGWEARAAGLHEDEITLHTGFVADIAVSVADPDDLITMTVEALVIDA